MRGLDRVIRAIYQPDKRTDDYIETIACIDDGSLFAVDTRSFIEWMLYVYGHYEPEIGSILRRCLDPGDVALDVGANIGVHTVCMARAVGPLGLVVALEPSPELVDRLRQNLDLNGLANRVRIVAKGAGRYNTTMPFYRAPLNNQGNGSFIAKADLTPEAIELPVVTLDSLVQELQIDRVRLVKIDVEGLELDTIAGAAELIATHRPYLVFEYLVPSQVQWDEFPRLLGVPTRYTFYEVANDKLLPLMSEPSATCMVLAEPQGD